ncbi:MAG: hypothetical protein QOJ05_1415 [Verrucomicrobiota bacterium]
MMRAFLLALVMLLPTTGICSSWKGPPVIIGRFGERLCAKHHQRLETTTVYGPGDGVCILFQPDKKMVKARAASPNALPIGIRQDKSQLYSRAVEVVYCKRCEAEVAGSARK